ncbi:hypothetical protein, partial [Streptomyces sp. DSM 41029]
MREYLYILTMQSHDGRQATWSGVITPGRPRLAQLTDLHGPAARQAPLTADTSLRRVGERSHHPRRRP